MKFHFKIASYQNQMGYEKKNILFAIFSAYLTLVLDIIHSVPLQHSKHTVVSIFFIFHIQTGYNYSDVYKQTEPHQCINLYMRFSRT